MSTPQYFKSFPDLDYTISANRAGIPTNIKIKDYFHLLRIREDIFKKDTLYYKYVIRNGERPDQIAYKEYGQESWYWIVLQTNDIVDYYSEWPLSFQELEKFILKKYGSYEKAGEVRHYETVDEYDGEGTMETYSSDEMSNSSFCFGADKKGIKNLKEILPIIEEMGCTYRWNQKGDQRISIDWCDE